MRVIDLSTPLFETHGVQEGAWITDKGQVLALNGQTHGIVAAKLLGSEDEDEDDGSSWRMLELEYIERAKKAGWIQITEYNDRGTGRFVAGIEYLRPTPVALRSLLRYISKYPSDALIRSEDEDFDLQSYRNVIRGEI